ncbi:Ribosome association toxin PasT (RatA) of the RatAB toxin-antitoxin module [Jatrophihabitans endophyticus]|uniref:Ribosome association toxin PasT (RatA) of the RatAB toxin-antitoxin module n=1 Tax=Jatrophihabitans endophyticus TaxID=1206085 RepID=A0A1M5PC19_9ACTN|nr:SRPBCC family protein [Jatrophihabitans endophyticus]SHG99257.1 Ribosome association toxin PasT (RatA) of the RatAB toxin-antitoxin module [Jatrophihabitans endophyticus]
MGSWTTSVLVPGPREEVFALFADRENYRALVPPVGARLVRPGRDRRQGEGAVHRVGLGPLGLREQIVALEPGRSFTYRAVTPLPVRHYIGVVDFHDDPRGGTRVDYTLDVEAVVPVPGPLLAVVVAGLAGGLARGATRELRRRTRG